MQIVTTKRDVIWNYAGTIFSLFSNFLILPALVYYLTPSELGLWYVFLAIGGLVTLFEFGFSPTFARNFVYCWSGAKRLEKEGCAAEFGENIDRHLAATLLSVCRRVYRIVSILAGLAMAIPGSAYVISISQGIDQYTVGLSWLTFCVATALNLYFLYLGSLLRGMGNISDESKVKVTSRLVQLVITTLLLFFGSGLIGAAAGFIACALVYRIGCHRAFWGSRKVISLNLADVVVSKSETRELFGTVSHNAIRDGIVMLANYATTQSSTIICSLFLSLSETGEFSIGMQFATAIANLSLALINSYRPMLQSAYQRGDNELLLDGIGKGFSLYIVMYFAGTLAVVCFAYPILNFLSTGSNFDLLVYLALSLYIFLLNWHGMSASVLANFNQIPYVKAYAVSALFGIVLSVLFVSCSGLGAWGLILGLTLSQLVYNNWKWPCYLAKLLNVKTRAMVVRGFSLWSNALGSVFRRKR